jgi:hypothetical protein
MRAIPIDFWSPRDLAISKAYVQIKINFKMAKSFEDGEVHGLRADAGRDDADLLKITNAVVVVFSLKEKFAQARACLFLRREFTRHLRQFIEYFQERNSLAQLSSGFMSGSKSGTGLPFSHLIIDVLAKLKVHVVVFQALGRVAQVLVRAAQLKKSVQKISKKEARVWRGVRAVRCRAGGR